MTVFFIHKNTYPHYEQILASYINVVMLQYFIIQYLFFRYSLYHLTMLVKKIFLITLILMPFCMLAQDHSFSYYDTESKQLYSDFYNAVSNKGEWKPYERKLDNLAKELDEDLRNSSGYTYEEKSNLLSCRGAIKLLKDVGDGISPDGYSKAINGLMVKLILLLYPEIKWENYKSYEAGVTIYKLTFRDYVVFSARHNKKSTLMKISWHDSRTSCNTIGGNFNTLGGFYKTFWDNSACKPSGSSALIAVTGFDYVSDMEELYAPVKPWVEN